MATVGVKGLNQSILPFLPVTDLNTKKNYNSNQETNQAVQCV